MSNQGKVKRKMDTSLITKAAVSNRLMKTFKKRHKTELNSKKD